jgi:HEAT repeat protein
MSEAKSSEPIAAQLRSPDLRRRLEALLRLKDAPRQAFEEDVLDALVENLSSASKAVQRHAAGAIAAAGIDDSAVVERLTALLDAPDAAARWAAAYALGLIDGALDLRACAPLLDALGNSDGDLRWAALELVVKLGRRHPGPIRDRLLALQERADANSRKMSLYALRDLGIFDPVALAAVRKACISADTQVRLAALSFLKHAANADPEAVDIALTCLKSDPDQGVRRAAAFTLGYLDDRSDRVVAALREAANATHDAAMRKAARQTLARLKEEP